MDRPLIASLANPLVKQARALRQRKARAETGLFLVEGIHHVGEAIQAGWTVEAILYAPESLTSSFAHDLVAGLPAVSHALTTRVLESLSDKENPQGILAMVHQRRTELPNVGSIRRGAALVSPQDPGNVGTILRTLDAVRGEALFLLDGGVDPYHISCVRASLGTLFWIPIVQTTFEEFFDWAQQHHQKLIGTSAHAEADYRQIKADRPWLLLLGNEQKGLSRERIAACDVTVSLPMQGRASSLNLAVAAGILLYHFADLS